MAIIGTGIAGADEFDIPAKSAILVDAATGQVLFEKDPHKTLPPASITKIMSLLLTFEAIDRGQASFDDMVLVSQNAEGMGGSQIYLSRKDKLPLSRMIEAVIIPSANDACVAIAEFIGGTEENFVRMMNQRAQELGMTDTHFINPTGLPADNHYTTAYDISLMARELIKYDKFREWAQVWHDTIQLYDREASITNTNSLIKYSGLKIDGVKTGHTDEAGYCLAASAEKDGFRLISVVLNTENMTQRDESSAELLEYGFRAFERKVVVKENEKDLPELDVKQGKTKTVAAYTGQSLQVVVLRGTAADLRRETFSLEKVAPISKGDKVGELVVYQGTKELGRVDLLASEDVAKANIFVRFFRWLWSAILKLVERFRH